MSLPTLFTASNPAYEFFRQRMSQGLPVILVNVALPSGQDVVPPLTIRLWYSQNLANSRRRHTIGVLSTVIGRFGAALTMIGVSNMVYQTADHSYHAPHSTIHGYDPTGFRAFTAHINLRNPGNDTVWVYELAPQLLPIPPSVYGTLIQVTTIPRRESSKDFDENKCTSVADCTVQFPVPM